MAVDSLLVSNTQPPYFSPKESSVKIKSDSLGTTLEFTVTSELYESTGDYRVTVQVAIVKMGVVTSGWGDVKCSFQLDDSSASWIKFNSSLSMSLGAPHLVGILSYNGRSSTRVHIKVTGSWSSSSAGDGDNFDITCNLSLSSEKYPIKLNNKTRDGSLTAEGITSATKNYYLNESVVLPSYTKLSGNGSRTITFNVIDNISEGHLDTISETYKGFNIEHTTESRFPWTANGVSYYGPGSRPAVELLNQTNGFYQQYVYYPVLSGAHETIEAPPATNLPSEVVKDRTRRGYNLLGYHWNDENGETAVAGQDVSTYWPNYQNNYTATIMTVYEPKVFKIQFVPNIPRKLSSKYPYKDGIKGNIIVGTKTMNFDTAEVIYGTSYVVPGLKKPDSSGGSDSYVFLADNDVVGYKFLGWSESSSAAEATYVPGSKTMYDFDIENTTKKLYGVWQPISNTATYNYYQFNDEGKVSTPTADIEQFNVSMGSTYVKDIPNNANTGPNTSDFVFYGWTRWKPDDYDDVKGLYTNIPALEKRCTEAGCPIIFPAKTDIHSRSESTYNGEAQWGDQTLDDEFWGIWTISGKSIRDRYGFQSIAATYVYTPEIGSIKEGFQYVSHTWIYDGTSWIPDAATKELLSQSSN